MELKNFWDINKRTITIIFLFVLITALFWGIRLWRFEELMTFGPDQALFMEDVYKIAESKKLPLIGPIVTSRIVDGKGFFTGPTFYYLLLPISIISKWDAILISKIYIIAWWLAGVALFFWLSRKFSFLAGLSAYAIFSVVPTFIYYSRFIWNPNILPFLGIIILVLLQHNLWFAVGVVTGLGISFNYDFLVWMPLLIFIIIFKKTLHSLALLSAGLILGSFPFLLFEIRHNFYNIRTLIDNTVQTPQSFAPYHLVFPLIGILFYAWGKLTFYLQNKKQVIGIFVSVLAFLLFLTKFIYSPGGRLGMPNDWDVRTQRIASRLICDDIGQRAFEVASTMDGLTQAPDIRWWLRIDGCLPLDISQYQSADVLYLVADRYWQPKSESLWEVTSLSPYKIENQHKLNNNLTLYKLVRL